MASEAEGFLCHNIVCLLKWQVTFFVHRWERCIRRPFSLHILREICKNCILSWAAATGNTLWKPGDGFLNLLKKIIWLHPVIVGEGDGTPLKYSCLENPMDGGAWWAAVYGVAQSRTRLKQLSSSSHSCGLWDPFLFSCGIWGLVPWPGIEPRAPALGA